jgi:hypothetical protein
VVKYLRPRHPAIDSVVFIDGDLNLVSTTDFNKFLLLLQLSIGEYSAHSSKGALPIEWVLTIRLGIPIYTFSGNNITINNVV